MRGSEKFNEALPGRRFVVVSNREPYEHVYDDQSGAVVVRRPAGGLTSALDPILQATSGDWIAWGSGDADYDVTDEQARLRVPPEDPRYTLHRIKLDQRDIDEYYFGFANQVLWPLCHQRPALMRVRARHWARYQSVNRLFADSVAAALQNRPAAVWFQDYHLATAPMHVRQSAPAATLAHFWHIPFPPPEMFRIASRGGDVLRGLVANDLVGFHLPAFAANFLRSVQEQLNLPVDFERRCIDVGGHTCWVRSFPISIDIDEFRAAASVPDAEARMQRLRTRFTPNDELLGVGVDRLDYSKGLEEKFKALDLLWEQNPELKERFTFVQVAVPSRTDIEAYGNLDENVERMAWSINDRHGTDKWTPIHLLKESWPAERLSILYRAADLCIVSSLQDGMNLVAKEFVASQIDQRGVLMLSQFAGAVEEMHGAVVVNPYDPEECALHIREALQMKQSERAACMTRLQGGMRSIYDWIDEIFELWGAAARGDEVPFSVADKWR